MREHELPSPPEIAGAPELAALAILQVAIQATTRALIAAHPELSDADFPQPPSGPAREAQRLFRLAFRLDRAVSRYRRALPDPMPESDPPADPDF